MKNNDLLLIDLSKNYSMFESNKSYVYLNRDVLIYKTVNKLS